MDPTSANPADEPTLSREAIDDLVEAAGGEIAFIEEIFSIFLADAWPRLDTLDTAVPTAQWTAVREVAHALGGSAANLGAYRCTALCRQLSAAAKADLIEDATRVAQALRHEIGVIRDAVPSLVSDLSTPAMEPTRADSHR